MKTEMKSLWLNEVWELVEPPSNQKIVGSKWIFKCKLDADGTVEHYKARLVAQGCLDLTMKRLSVPLFIRFLLTMGAQHQLQLRCILLFSKEN